MSPSGEHALDLETAQTEPCGPPDDPEDRKPTWPKMAAVRLPNLDLETSVLDQGDEHL